jgi:hypothetical protein
MTQWLNRSILLPLSRLDQLANFALDQVTLERADVINVELAVEVIGFVLKGARQQVVTSLLENLPGHVLRPDRNFLGATPRSRGSLGC